MASMLEACRANQGLPAKLTAGSRVGYDLSKVGAGASRGFSGKKKLEAAPWSGTWPAPGSSLDLDFANNRGFVRGMGQGGVMDGITFTRASNGNYVNEQGLLVGGGTGNQTSANLLTFPQDFDNAIWTNINNFYWPNYSVISANAGQAPDGTYTADAFFDTAGQTGNCQRSNGGDVGATYSLATPLTVSCYVKSISHRYFNLIAANDPAVGGITVDLQTGVVTGSGGIVAGTGFAISVGDGWYRVGFQVSSASTGNTSIAGIKVGLRDNPDYTFTINRYQVYQYAQQGTGVLVWGAKLERGTEATPYYPTNINVPRFDWASTTTTPVINQITRSDSAVANLGSLTNATTSLGLAPDGFNTAVLLTESTATGAHHWAYGLSNNNVQHTVSVFVLPNGRTRCVLYSSTSENVSATFDLTAQTYVIGGNSGATAASITPVENGWFRLSVTGIGRPYLQVSLLDNSGNISYAGNGTSGMYVWGVQIQLGGTLLSYQATGAHIPTTTPLRPTPTCNGLLIEEARTNRLLWCRDATQTQWVKTDITAAKDQTGIDGVANAASSLTATADGGTCIQTITLASGSRTGSIYLKRITGTGTVQVSLDGSTWSTVELSDTEWRRIVLSGTVTNPVVGVRLAVSGDAVAMDFGQVEDGAFATTPILTTTATATRASDEASISNVDSFWNYKCGTVLFSGTVRPLNTTGTVVIVGDGTYYRGLFINAGTSNVVGAVLSPNFIAGFSGPASLGLAGLIAGQFQSIKIASSWNLNRMVSGLNGVLSSIGYAVGYSLQGPQTGAYKYTLFIGSSLSNHGHTKTISRLVFSVSETTENGVLVLSGSQK